MAQLSPYGNIAHIPKMVLKQWNIKQRQNQVNKHSACSDDITEACYRGNEGRRIRRAGLKIKNSTRTTLFLTSTASTDTG